MLKIQSTGKNIEQAIENGLAELKVSRDNVSIKIIEKGGIFKKAKVEMIVDEDRYNSLKATYGDDCVLIEEIDDGEAIQG